MYYFTLYLISFIYFYRSSASLKWNCFLLKYVSYIMYFMYFKKSYYICHSKNYRVKWILYIFSSLFYNFVHKKFCITSSLRLVEVIVQYALSRDQLELNRTIESILVCMWCLNLPHKMWDRVHDSISKVEHADCFDGSWSS